MVWIIALIEFRSFNYNQLKKFTIEVHCLEQHKKLLAWNQFLTKRFQLKLWTMNYEHPTHKQWVGILVL
jgi:hypothetical protein